MIIEMLMSYIFNQINGAFHNYLSLYIGDNDSTTFVRSYCILFICRLVVTFAPERMRATNKRYALQKSCYCCIHSERKAQKTVSVVEYES